MRCGYGREIVGLSQGWTSSSIGVSQSVKEGICKHALIQEFLANGAAQRIHVERLPAYAPELNPGEGFWAQLKGVEWRHLCCFNMPHLRHELRDAVKRVRRKQRILKGCFAGAGLLIFMHVSVEDHPPNRIEACHSTHTIVSKTSVF